MGDYISLRTSEDFYDFWALAAELGGARADGFQEALSSLTENDKKAFLINLYNVMIFHGVSVFGRSSGSWGLYTFFFTPLVSYRVGRATLCLDEVEHGLLRLRPEYFKDPSQAACLPLRVENVDPRIHMALNCASKGCPIVAMFNGATLDAELDDAVKAFVASDANVHPQPEKGRVEFSQIFEWYLVDFLGEPAPTENREIAKGLLQWVLPFTVGDRQDAVEKCLELIDTGASFELSFPPYDWSTNGAEVALDWRVYTPRLP